MHGQMQVIDFGGSSTAAVGTVGNTVGCLTHDWHRRRHSGLLKLDDWPSFYSLHSTRVFLFFITLTRCKPAATIDIHWVGYPKSPPLQNRCCTKQKGGKKKNEQRNHCRWDSNTLLPWPVKSQPSWLFHVYSMLIPYLFHVYSME
jgi:hypothetical protein